MATLIVIQLALSPAFLAELWMLEVDTFDEANAANGRAAFVAAMQKAYRR